MNKPNNYKNTQAGGNFEQIELGGHYMGLVKVEETTTKVTGKPMLVVYLDTLSNDKQPNFFSTRYKKDTRPEKKWGCIHYIVTEDNEGNCSRSFKSFCAALEESNKGFQMPWGTDFQKTLAGKYIGGVFGEEEYESQTGDIKMSRKIRYFCDINKVKEQKIPKQKLLDRTIQNSGYMTSPPPMQTTPTVPPITVPSTQTPSLTTGIDDLAGFEEIISDGDVPF